MWKIIPLCYHLFQELCSGNLFSKCRNLGFGRWLHQHSVQQYWYHSRRYDVHLRVPGSPSCTDGDLEELGNHSPGIPPTHIDISSQHLHFPMNKIENLHNKKEEQDNGVSCSYSGRQVKGKGIPEISKKSLGVFLWFKIFGPGGNLLIMGTGIIGGICVHINLKPSLIFGTLICCNHFNEPVFPETDPWVGLR